VQKQIHSVARSEESGGFFFDDGTMVGKAGENPERKARGSCLWFSCVISRSLGGTWVTMEVQ
jgi:hypothetical protein